MAYARWPASLPDRPQQDSYDYSPTDNAASFSPSIGAPIKRLRSTVSTADNQVSFWMDTEQLDTFERFYRDEIGRGSLRFMMPHPITRSDTIFLMTSRFKVSPISHDWWAVSFTMQDQPV